MYICQMSNEDNKVHSCEESLFLGVPSLLLYISVF